MSIKRINDSFTRQDSVITVSDDTIDKKLKESYNRLVGIKSQYTEAVKKVNDLVTSRVRTPVTMELIECYKKAVDDLKLEFEDEKSTFEWYKKVKNKTLTEAEIKLSPDITYNPNATFSLRDLAKKADEDEKAAIAAEQERVRREEAKVEVQGTIDELHKMIQSGDGTEDILDMLFEALVPPEGKCETVAGEMVRAMMRLLYRDYNDGDKFYEGYGLETCASSAAYLMDRGFDGMFMEIMEESHRYDNNDEAYTVALLDIADAVVRELADNEDLFVTSNEEDSRDFDASEVEDNQPRYDFEVYVSDDLAAYIDAEQCDSWKLKEYVEDILSWEREYDGAEVETPWGHYDTSLTITGLTRDGLDRIEDAFRNVDIFWEDLVNELRDEYGEPGEDEDEEDYDDEYDEDHDDMYECLKEASSFSKDGFRSVLDEDVINFVVKITRELDGLMYVSKSDIPEHVLTDLEDKGFEFDKDAVLQLVDRVLEGSIDEDLAIIKEPLVESDEDEEEEIFTAEEQEEYDIDEYGVSQHSYDQYHHCSWCGEPFPEFDGKKELNMGWLCDSCVSAIKSRGEKMYFEE